LVAAVPVSPKVQAKVNGPTPAEVVAVNVAGEVASIEAGLNVNATVGTAATVMVWLEVALTASASVAVTVTVNEPPAA
jgi:hypothetical protein